MRLPTRVLRMAGAQRQRGRCRRFERVPLPRRAAAVSAGSSRSWISSSHNGTFVNGQRVSAAPVTGADIIGIGPATFRLVGEELQEFIDKGDVSLLAQNLTVRLPNGKVLLDNVSFPLGERCLVGIIGPSGAGKSTLLGALTGMRPATRGRCSTTAGTFTRTTRNCGTGSGWFRKRTSCTPS